MTWIKFPLAIALFLMVSLGCTTRQLGHTLVPGYSTWRAAKDTQSRMYQEALEAELKDRTESLVRVEDFDNNGFLVGVEIPSLIAAMNENGVAATTGMALWDVVKGFAWYYAGEALEHEFEEDDEPPNKKQKQNGKRIPADNNNQSSDLYIQGNNNNFDAENESIDDIYIQGDNNSVNLNEEGEKNNAAP